MLTTVLKNYTLQPREVYLFTDSSTVLAWIRSHHRHYKQSVTYYIEEILYLTQEECCNSEHDSNGGPLFLYLSEDMCLQQQVKTNTTGELYILIGNYTKTSQGLF